MLVEMFDESSSAVGSPSILTVELPDARSLAIRLFTYGTGTGPEADRQRANLRAFQWGAMRPADATYLLPERLMEARVALQEAELAGDKAAAAAAQTEIDEVLKAQAELAAPQAAADAPSSQ